MQSQMGLMHKQWKNQWFFITAHREFLTIFYGNHISSNQNVPPGQKSAFTQSSLTSWPWKSHGWDLRLQKALSIQAHLTLSLWIYTKSRVLTNSRYTFSLTGDLNICRRWHNSLLFGPFFAAQNLASFTLTKHKQTNNDSTHVCVFTFY